MASRHVGGTAEVPAGTTLRTRVTTTSVADTIALGERLGRVAAAGDLVCLWGELGAGKTQVAKGIAAGLGVDATVNSPTFILMNEYAGRLPLFHVDLYRLADAADALAGGVVDDRQSDGLTVVEWPERMGDVLPVERVDVRIAGTGDEPRAIDVEAGTDRLARYVDAARETGRG
jgi:tRNA threonylcarbamoyladenosine biosynthesis protein TsaE